MELEYNVFGSGQKKILLNSNMLSVYRTELEMLNKNNDYTFYMLNPNQFKKFFKHDIFNNVSFKELEREYNRNKELRNYYNTIIRFCEKEKITHINISNTGMYWHPEFIKKLKDGGKRVVALSTADDDYRRINYCSLPYTKYYDYHFHVGVMFDKNGKTIADRLREVGGNPVWIPLGARLDHIGKVQRDRDIEIVYIGNVNPRKLFRLSKLKRHFGDRLKLYGGQGNGDWKSFKGIIYKIANKIFRLGYIEAVSEDKLVEIYSRAKIGFNMHLIPWKGPSNSRMYELPCNKVMQLCDNIQGLSRVYEIGKEVVGYDGIGDAIEKIEYYLNNDDERVKIAEAGYKKAIECYTTLESLKIRYRILFGDIDNIKDVR